MSKLTLPLEDGKFYVCRDGEVRQAYAAPDLSGGVIELGGTLVYETSGSVWRHPTSEQVKSPRDAVADHVEPVKGHPHAALMALYAQDAAETDEPWTRWEARTGHGSWIELGRHPIWTPEQEYRRKPKTIRIGEYDVPEPLRVAPTGENYWVPVLGSAGSEIYTWGGDPVDDHYLSSGLMHSTREAADTHARALIALTKS